MPEPTVLVAPPRPVSTGASPLVPPTTTPASPPPPNGLQALVAAGVAMLGVVTALFPAAPVTAALVTALPQLRVALPVVLTATGSLWAALSHPPTTSRSR